MNNKVEFSPGWDAQAISRIAKSHYGSFRNMFEAHGWDAPGDKMMTSAPTYIVQEYGSIQRFETIHKTGAVRKDRAFWSDQTSILFTSFWGWDPETWGTVGFTGDRGKTRRSNLLEELSDPFICVCYVTSNKTYIDPNLRGMIAGFYLVSHETGDRNEFTHPIHHERDLKKWQHSLRALRAFNYLPEYRLSVRDFDPFALKNARSISAMGEIIKDQAKISRLQKIPWIEVPVYCAATNGTNLDDGLPDKGMVKAGPSSYNGYEVPEGTRSLPRALYVLRLHGNADAYLGRASDGRSIYKIGISVSPETRRQSFQKSMPRGAFKWRVDRTSKTKGKDACLTFEAAVAGEYAMKRHLSTCADWLGGEFYLAHESDLNAAWQIGHRAAIDLQTNSSPK